MGILKHHTQTPKCDAKKRRQISAKHSTPLALRNLVRYGKANYKNISRN